MKTDELLFELRAHDGHTWRLYLDGRTEGFPDGSVVKNHALPHIQSLTAHQSVSSACWPEKLHPISGDAAPHADLRVAAGTHGDQFDVRVADRVVARLAWAQLVGVVVKGLAKMATGAIKCEDGRALAIYEKRPNRCADGHRDGLLLDFGIIRLTQSSARGLALALLAYAEQQNERCRWLIREDSDQR